MAIQNFSEVIGNLKTHLRDYLEEQGIDTSNNFTCISPFHNDEHPSCSLIDERAYCHSCNRYFDIFDAAHCLEGMPTGGGDWVEKTLLPLTKRYNISVEQEELTGRQLELFNTRSLYKEIVNYLRDSDAGEAYGGPEYSESLRKLGVGVIDNYKFFIGHLEAEGFSEEFLIKTDVKRKDIFGPDTLIFSWFDHKGRVIGFSARDLQYEAKKEVGNDTKKKYISQRQTGPKRTPFLKKSHTLYGIEHLPKGESVIYLFEGQKDVITAFHNGIENTAAISGGQLTEHQVRLLIDLGIREVILCFDRDKAGETKLGDALNLLANIKEIRARVHLLPSGEDPDSFLRENSRKDFFAQPNFSAFEYRLQQAIDEDADPVESCRIMVQYIVSEPSPVERERLCKTLSAYTGVSLRAVVEELTVLIDSKARERAEERSRIIEKVIYDLKKADVQDKELVLQQGLGSLVELNKKYDKELLSERECLTAIDEQKKAEESKTNLYAGFTLGPDLQGLEETLCGEWTRDVFMLIGGKPNSGKTALVCKLAYSIAKYNEDAVVLALSIDDTKQQLIPRFVCIADDSLKVTQNMIAHPAYWEAKGVPVMERREEGYKNFRELVASGRLVLKDANQGASLFFLESYLGYYRDKYPDKKIAMFLDNFHKLKDFTHLDERVRNKLLSQRTKELAEKYHTAVISTAEYTKLRPGVKPTNESLAETNQIHYDGNYIIHLWNEVSELAESFNICHQTEDWQGKAVYLPRLECIVGKNKVSEWKGTFFLDFFPAHSNFRYVSQDQVLKDQRMMVQHKQHQKNEDFFDSKAFGVE